MYAHSNTYYTYTRIRTGTCAYTHTYIHNRLCMNIFGYKIAIYCVVLYLGGTSLSATLQFIYVYRNISTEG